ncbi:MAG: DUF262 domain-containing protein [Pseudomonadota bacterium]
MNVNGSKISIANIRDMVARGDLITNHQYQRAPGLWPTAARSYFIDTIVEGFIFPPIYFHEYLERTTKKTRTEIVDGQQRITTIIDFLGGEFALGKNSKAHQGMRFEDFDEDTQHRFLSYTVSVDTIREAGRNQILQMFRRMNAYTLPLNDAEKRHSEFFGEFKDFVTRVLDDNAILTEWDVLTARQVMRMGDAEFVADLAMAFEQGVVNTSKTNLYAIYKKYDEVFVGADEVEVKFRQIFSFISEQLSSLRGSYMTKPAAFFALCCALYHNRYGLPNFLPDGVAPVGRFHTRPIDEVTRVLLNMAAAHETKDSSTYPVYVKAMNDGSNRAVQRTDRISQILVALGPEQ